MRKRKHPNRGLRLCWLSLLLIFVAYVLAMPIVAATQLPAPESELDSSRLLNSFLGDLLQRFAEFIVGLWFFFLGSSIGSFLNVVVYRMPLGRSIVTKGSYCPNCRVSIRSIDNIPVIGWIKLRGRCRACRLPISSRYPIVEALVGTLFLLVYCIEFEPGAINLPGITQVENFGIAETLLNNRWDVVAIAGFHLLLVSILVSASLIRYDGPKVPRKLTLFGLIVSGAMTIGWPSIWEWARGERQFTGTVIDSLFPLGYDYQTISVFNRAVASGELATWLLGLLAGATVGFGAGALLHISDYREPRGEAARSSIVVGFAWVGAFLGWQSLLSVLALSVIGMGIGELLRIFTLRKHRIPALAWISVAAFVHVLFWKVLFEQSYWPGAVANWLLLVHVFALTLGLRAAGLLHRKATTVTSKHFTA